MTDRFPGFAPARPLSTRGKLIAPIVGLLVAFIWALAIYSVNVLQRQFNDVLAEQQSAATRHVAAELEHKLRERIEGLRQAARSLPADLSPPGLDPYLEQKTALHAAFSGGIAVVGMDGRTIADYPVVSGRRGTYFGDRDYFRQVVATKTPFIDKPIIGRALRRPVLTIAVPVFEESGHLRAVMTGIIDLAAPNFLGYVADRTIAGKAEFFVFSRAERLILAATDRDRVLTALPARGLVPVLDSIVDGFEGSGLGSGLRGVPVLYSGKQVDRADWVVLAALPTDVAFGPVKIAQRYLYGVAAAMTLLAVLLAYWLARQVLAPLEDDGSDVNVGVSAVSLSYQDKEGAQVCVRDISERKEQQTRITRLVRIYAVLSGINSAIVRVHERQALLDAVCRVAVEAGQFGMAWVGLLDQAGQVLHPAAGCGIDLEAIGDFPVALGAEVPSGHGRAYEALSSKRAVHCNDISRVPQVGPVRAQALKYGYRSVCVLPLVVDGKGIGVMGLYAREAGFFDAEEMQLLDELAADISFALQYIEREERLNYLAYYDALTGLPNRNLFLDRLTQLIHGAKDGSHGVAAILLDLDHFTHLNETEGRHVGDAVLREIAARLEASVWEPRSLARIGADTFAIAVAAPKSGVEVAKAVQARVFDALNQPFVGDGSELRLAGHAGIALYPGDGEDGETLFQSAEAALKEAKSSGMRCMYYAPEINARTAAVLALERDLQSALDAGQFVLHFQPRVDLRSGEIVGAEALLRWQHPERGLVPPAEFIPVAEQSGLIVPIGAWVIDTVCARQAAWLAEGLDIVPVAVNLSPLQFAHGTLLPTLQEALARHRLEAKYLELELTESLVMQEPEEAVQTMRSLRQYGLRLSLDDFGTGYSSLAYLSRFPFDFVKIDRAFVRHITENPGDAAIATAVIAMAHRLNLRVVAEGVETEGQACYLRQHGCDQIQGYYFSPPVPAEAFIGLLAAAKRLDFQLAPPVAGERTVLLVDDEPLILAALRRALRREGYRVLTASSAKAGLELLAVNPVQVIVSDQRMPGMSGSEFLGIVKELYPDTVRIILSGYTDLEVVTDAVNRGAVYKFLTKPWNDDLLKAQIRDAFLRYRPLARPSEALASD